MELGTWKKLGYLILQKQELFKENIKKTLILDMDRILQSPNPRIQFSNLKPYIPAHFIQAYLVI